VSTQTLSLTLAGSGTPPIITGIDSGSATEDQNVQSGQQLRIAGTLHNAHAPVSGDPFLFKAGRSDLGTGGFIIKANGEWQFNVVNSNAQIQALAAGEKIEDSFTVQGTDGTTHKVTVTVIGTNDAPVLQAQSQTVTEDGTQLNGHMIATDVDNRDTQTFSLANQVDGFTLHADGSYSFDPSHASYQYLSAGQTLDVVIPIAVTDSAGATDTQTLTITVTGADDAPATVIAPPPPPVAEEGMNHAHSANDPVLADAADVTPDTASDLVIDLPVDNLYLQFAAIDSSPPVNGIAGANHSDQVQAYLLIADDAHDGASAASATDTAATSPLEGYLAAAGMDHADLSRSATHELPPKELILDTPDGLEGAPPDAGTPTDDPALVVPVDLPEPVHQEDIQHHSV
jgi:VCBS repeat-containing protein